MRLWFPNPQRSINFCYSIRCSQQNVWANKKTRMSPTNRPIFGPNKNQLNWKKRNFRTGETVEEDDIVIKNGVVWIRGMNIVIGSFGNSRQKWATESGNSISDHYLRLLGILISQMTRPPILLSLTPYDYSLIPSLSSRYTIIKFGFWCVTVCFF